MSELEKNDFDEYINGKWKSENKIPNDLSSLTISRMLSERTLENIKNIMNDLLDCRENIQNIKTNELDLAIKLYKSGINHNKNINFRIIKLFLDYIDLINNENELIEALSFLQEYQMNAFFRYYINPDAKNNNKNILYLFHDSVTLPDKSYYFDDNKKNIIDEYKKYIDNLYNLSDKYGLLDKKKISTDTILVLETLMAKKIDDNEIKRDIDKNYNKMTVMDFCKKILKNDKWMIFFKKINIDSNDYIIVDNIDYYRSLRRILINCNIKILKNYLKFVIINGYAAYLSEDFRAIHFKFYENVLKGVKENTKWWKDVLDVCDSLIGEIIGKIYIDKYFPESSKKQMDELVINIKYSLENIINNLDWMQPNTKKLALMKLNSLSVKIGYPNQNGWIDYDNIKICENDFIVNILVLSKYMHKKLILDRVGKNVNKDIWHMVPHEINAYFHPEFNEIVFPAGILQTPYFTPLNVEKIDSNINDMDIAILSTNYGSIGSVIGHEITHGYDDQGSKYNYEGKLINWWDNESMDKYKNLAQNIIDQYDQYKIDDNNVNGKLTVGENIADIGGVKISYYAFINHLKKIDIDPNKELNIKNIEYNNKIIYENNNDIILTPIKIFFISYAISWRCIITEREALNKLLVDPHSPNKFRINGTLSNLVEFYNAFNIKKGDGLYREKRTTIW
jgi:predicted metalloendopeptidase